MTPLRLRLLAALHVASRQASATRRVTTRTLFLLAYALATRAQALEALIGLALVTVGVWLVLATFFPRGVAWGAACFVAGGVMFTMATFGDRLTGARRVREGERE